jgi:hypothetical protein
MEYNAVLLVIYFVGSIFNVQLGAPLVQELPYQSIEDCMAHAAMIENQQTQIDLEWTVFSRAQCMTREEYDAAVAAQQTPQQNE